MIARGKRLRVCVDVDCTTSAATKTVAGELARRTVASVNDADTWKVHGVTVSDVSAGTFIGRWEANGREYVRVAKDTGEVLP